MEYWLVLGANGFLYAIGVGIIRLFIKSMKIEVKKDIEDVMDWQSKYCNQRFDALEESDAFQWKAIDGHGHKGLDKEGSKVVRG